MNLALAVLLLAIAPSSAPPEATDLTPQYGATRYTVGQRMIWMEKAWMSASSAQKDAAVPTVTSAVSQFFGGQLSQVAQRLDTATAALTGREPSPLDALDLRIDPAVHSPDRATKLHGTWAYAPSPSPTPLVIRFRDEDLRVTPGVPFTVPLDSEALPPGSRGADRQLRVTASGGWEREVRSSVIADFDRRRARLQSSSGAARDLVRLVERAGSTTTEQDVLAHQAMELAERLQSGTPVRQLGSLPLATLDGALLRAEWPVPLPPAPVVVIALHGAGGSENLFFEGYGAGLGPRLARERGWVFIAPRSGPSGAELALQWARTQLRIEPRAVLLIGHSMGGAMALRASTPPLAMALFAPAASSVPEPLRAIPTYLAVGSGEIPFLKNSAERLRTQLTSPLTEFVTLPHCEHLMVVAEGLPGAFAFFDRVLRDRGRDRMAR